MDGKSMTISSAKQSGELSLERAGSRAA